MDHGELIRAAQQGDREAFDELVRQTYVDTFTLAHRLTGNEEDARDVAQDAYFRGTSFRSVNSQGVRYPVSMSDGLHQGGDHDLLTLLWSHVRSPLPRL